MSAPLDVDFLSPSWQRTPATSARCRRFALKLDNFSSCFNECGEGILSILLSNERSTFSVTGSKTNEGSAANSPLSAKATSCNLPSPYIGCQVHENADGFREIGRERQSWPVRSTLCFCFRPVGKCHRVVKAREIYRRPSRCHGNDACYSEGAP